jgi:hypothetical protein
MITQPGCPRMRSDMTPCIRQDGDLAMSADGHCVGCGWPVARVEEEIGRPIRRVSRAATNAVLGAS